MKKIQKVYSMILVVLLVISLFPFPVSANSAQSWWSGTDASGAMITDKDCPLIVEHELLTFDIHEFPQNHYFTLEEFLAYSGKVTAEYTFYNPTDYTVDATLVFPFGNMPDYAYIYDNETETYALNADTNKYEITINGESVSKTLRHTLSLYGTKFVLENDLPKLVLENNNPEIQNGFLSDSFYSPDLPVHKYTYLAKNVDKEEYDAASASIYVNEDNMKTRIYMENQCGGSAENLKNGVRMDTWVDLEEEFSVYVIGEPLKQDFDWKYYANGACEDEIDGTMELVGQESLTFKEFALSKYDETSGVLEHDWYNAIVESMNYHQWACGALHSTEINLDVSRQLMRWYEYDITVEPGERIINSVTAPIYPSIAGDYEPPVYQYTYLLSPAKTWKEFGNLDIVIDSPYYMIQSGPEGFEYENPGYELHLTGLPEGELYFKLSESPEPKSANRFDLGGFILGGFWPFLLILIGIVTLLVIIVKRMADGHDGKK